MKSLILDKFDINQRSKKNSMTVGMEGQLQSKLKKDIGNNGEKRKKYLKYNINKKGGILIYHDKVPREDDLKN